MPETFITTTTHTAATQTIVDVSTLGLTTDDVLLGEVDFEASADNTNLNLSLATAATPTFSNSFGQFLNSYNGTNNNSSTSDNQIHLYLTGTSINFRMGGAIDERMRARFEIHYLTEAKRTRALSVNNIGNSTSGRVVQGRGSVGRQNSATAVTHLVIESNNNSTGKVHWSKRQFVATGATPSVGNPIGLLLSLTYAA